jgi:fructose-bisphosphate aldolase, class I
MAQQRITDLLGAEAEDLLHYTSPTIGKELLQAPGPDFIDRVFLQTNRSIPVLRSLSTLFHHGRLAGSGYLSILPIDQDLEHTAGFSFAPNPIYFDPENILQLAIEGGCNAVATSFGNLGMVARKYAHKIPFIVKINHNELLTYPTKYNQILFGSVEEAWNMGAVAVGATIYFGSAESNRQIIEVAQAFEKAHQLGMATILWCYTRNAAFKTADQDYHVAADITGQANRIGVTLQADIIKQKMAENNGGFRDLNFSKWHPDMYDKLATDHPIDLCRYQVVNCYMGRAGLINSGGESQGETDLQQSVRTAVINKRAGGMGLILGRRAFQRPFGEGVALLHLVQDVYLDTGINLA